MPVYRSPIVVFLLAFCLRLFLFTANQEPTYSVDLSPVREPAQRDQNILILVVLNSLTDPGAYEFPLSTLSCYAERHNYSLAIVEDSDYSSSCRQKDYMFRRHCITSTILSRSPTTDWLLFLDADVAVANPDRLIEEYLDSEADLVMYDRFVGWEIAMGSYLARNCHWTRNFLWTFADFELNLPESFHGTDNGAIHAFVLKELQPSSLHSGKPCLAIWERSTGFDDLFLYEACIRTVLGSKTSFGRLKIIPKGRGWVRDGWITQSKWSRERDFMLHGFKTADRRYRTALPLVDSLRELFATRFMWYSFLEELQLPECQWNYDRGLMISAKELDKLLLPLHRQVQRRYFRTLAVLSTRL